MTRKEQLKRIGEMNVNEHMSYFIIPIPHNFYKNNNSVFEDIKHSNWKIINEEKNTQLNAYNIKSYIYDNMIPNLNDKNKKTFIEGFKTLLLRKEINQPMELDNFEFIVKHIDLWIFEENIAFFVIKPELNTKQLESLNINDINNFNKLFRAFKFLKLETKDNITKLTPTPIHEGEQYFFIDYLLTYTYKKDTKKSFLKISSKDFKEYSKDNKTNLLYPVYNTSANAKLMTAYQTKHTTFNNGKLIEKYCGEDLDIDKNINIINVLEETPFYLATCSDMNPTNNWTSDPKYIYSLIDNGGFNIWKYSSGLTIYDSFVMFGLADDGGKVVENMRDNFYFIYILNLYINFQIRYIENSIIDKDFESININYWYKKLQKLKNQFISDEIGIKFQENEINKSISNALETKNILDEVTTNLISTKSITKDNNSIFLTLIGFIIVTIFQDNIKSLFDLYGVFIFSFAVPFSLIIVKYRNKIRNYFKL